jgi:tetratricopeptide (TPR) repeat protein
MRVVRGSTAEKVKAAQALLSAGKAPEAVAALEEAVAADPSSLDARKALARAAEKAEDVVKSYLAWREAQGVAVSAKDAADCKEQADRLMRQYGERPSQATVRRGAEASASRGEFAAAVETYRRAVAMSPLDVEARLGLGGSLLGLALRTASKPLFEEGISHYDVAVRVAPEDYRGWIGRAETRRWKGDFDGAISDASAAISRRKDAAQAYNTRGLAFYQALQFESAVADFNVVVTLAPMLATPRISRAGAYLAMGRYDEAEADLTAAEARSPSDAEKQTIASVREQVAARRKADRK